jgi:hypothetical protein
MKKIDDFSIRDKKLREEILALNPHEVGSNGDTGFKQIIVKPLNELTEYESYTRDIYRELLAKYPYICEHEWKINKFLPQRGVGDLVFTDGKGNYMVMEVKWLNSRSGPTQRTKRRKKRKKVKKQALKYGKAYFRKHPEAKSIIAVAATNEGFIIHKLKKQ